MTKISRTQLELGNESALRRIDALTLQASPLRQALQQLTEPAIRWQETLDTQARQLTESAIHWQETLDTQARQLTESIHWQETLGERALQQLTEPAIRWKETLDTQARQLTESARLAALALQESPAMQALRDFSNLPFSSAVRERVFSELDSIERTQIEPGEHPDFPIDQDIQLEIQRELEGNRDYKALSERAQVFLLYVYHYYLLPILINCMIVPMIIAHTQKVQTELQENKTPAEIRSYVRKPVHGINKELLKGYRAVKGSNVHLRKEPSMRSKIITKLPSGKLIRVQNKSKRSWLLVEVDIEGEVFVGWISRRYTTYFK